MPSKSIRQQKIMAKALDCKTGKSSYCPPKIQRIADSMSKKDLKDFASTPHEGLPNRVGESIVYKIRNVNNTLLDMFKDWLTNKDIQFIENDDELEILNDYDLEKDDQHQLLSYIQKIGLKKVWENVGTQASPIGSTYSTLSTTVGMKFVNPPGRETSGSGDKFDNLLPIGNLKELKKKKKEAFQNALKKR